MFSLHPLCLSNCRNSVVASATPNSQRLGTTAAETTPQRVPLTFWQKAPNIPSQECRKDWPPTLRCCFSAGCYFRIVFRFVHWTCWVEILQWEERDYTRHTTAHCENSELVRNPVRHLRCSAAPANLTPNTDKSVDTPVFQVKFSAWFYNCNINHLLVFPQIMLKVMSVTSLKLSNCKVIILVHLLQ